MSKQIEYLSDYEKEADLRRETFGKTEKYTTGFPNFDKYLGFGFGNRHGYEIVTIFGDPGVGKSTFSLNIIAAEMVKGTKVGLMILEDDMPDVYNRLRQIIFESGMMALKKNKNVDVIPQHMLEEAWTFEQILKWIEDKNEERGIELFLIDHINFIFDNAELENPNKELAEQRKFMRKLNFMCRKRKLTVILVSHTAKGNAEGMGKVYGTTAITQVSTKVLGLKQGESSQFVVNMYKSRFTQRRQGFCLMSLNGLRLEDSNGTIYPDSVSNGSSGNGKKNKSS